MLCQAFNAPLGAVPVICPSRAHANHHFSGGFNFIWYESEQNSNINQKANSGNINNHLNWINDTTSRDIFLNGVGDLAEYKTEVIRTFTIFFNDGRKLEHLKRMFNKADMNTKIDIYSSAISLRWAWNFFLSAVVPEPSMLYNNENIQRDKDRINKNYKLIFNENTYTIQSL